MPARVLSDAYERAALNSQAAAVPGVHADRVLFSAKESLIKAWSALDAGWPGFSGFRVRLHPDGAFTARVLVPGPVGELAGRWGVRGDLAGTAVALPAPAQPVVPHSRCASSSWA